MFILVTSSTCRAILGAESKFQKSSRENAQGVEIFHTEPLFTALLKTPLARGRGAHQLPHPTSATKLGPVLPIFPFDTGRNYRNRFSSKFSHPGF